jgi:hypothetical protein
VLALATWASERIAALATIDPESYTMLNGALDEVLAAIQGVVDSHLGSEVLGWTNALVLGVQQLVTTLRLSSGAAATGGEWSVSGMAAAQQAMQDALLTAPRTGPMGGVAAPQVALAALALFVAAIPRAPAQDAAPAAPSPSATSAFGIPSEPGGMPARARSSPAAATSSDGSMPADTIPLTYDPVALDAYFARRPGVVLRRNAQVASRMGSWLATVLVDWRLGKLESNMPLRATQAGVIIEDMGPAYIKIAQQLSTRVDLVPPPFLEEFKRLQVRPADVARATPSSRARTRQTRSRSLTDEPSGLLTWLTRGLLSWPCAAQDNVRTFSTVEARYVLEDGLGCPVDQVRGCAATVRGPAARGSAGGSEGWIVRHLAQRSLVTPRDASSPRATALPCANQVFEWLSAEPLAAASLGQVRTEPGS